MIIKALRRPRTLSISETHPKVNKFLNSKSRKSEQTKTVYSFALSHFQTFLEIEYNKEYNAETILIAIRENKINVYTLLDNFVGYLTERQDASNSNTKLSSQSINLYFAGVRSYLEYYDIDTHRYKNKVTLPRKFKPSKEAINAEDIRTILLSCTNNRLKVFLLVLASSGMRANEATCLRNRDIEFSSIPTKVHIRSEISKTKQSRDIYISNESNKELKKFIDSKYSNKDEYKKHPDHLVFSLHNHEIQPIHIYGTLSRHFFKVLKKVEKDKRKEGQGVQRREISFHSFRTFVKTVISTQTNSDFSEFFLGHSYSTYWSMKERERRELYIKCMKYLTFLDYPTVETVGKDFESKLAESNQEVEHLQDLISDMQREKEREKLEEGNKITKLLNDVYRNMEKSVQIRDKEIAELKNRLKSIENKSPKKKEK